MESPVKFSGPGACSRIGAGCVQDQGTRGTGLTQAGAHGVGARAMIEPPDSHFQAIELMKGGWEATGPLIATTKPRLRASIGPAAPIHTLMPPQLLSAGTRHPLRTLQLLPASRASGHASGLGWWALTAAAPSASHLGPPPQGSPSIPIWKTPQGLRDC